MPKPNAHLVKYTSSGKYNIHLVHTSDKAVNIHLGLT